MSGDNGRPVETVTLPRELLQAIVDYLGRCPAGDVYPLLRRLEEEVAAGPEQDAALGRPVPDRAP